MTNTQDSGDTIVPLKVPARPLYDTDGDLLDCSVCGSERVRAHVGSVPTLFPGIQLKAEAGDGWYHCMQCGTYFNTRRARFSSWPIALLGSLAAGVVVLAAYWLIDWLRWL